MYTHPCIHTYMYVCISELGGLVQPGNRFVSCEPARAAVCNVRMGLKNDSVAFPFSLFTLRLLPFSLPHLPPILLSN